MKNSDSLLAILVTLILVAPASLVFSEDTRAGAIVRQITTLGDGKNESTVTFSGTGSDSSLFVRVPNGSTIISATINLTGEPFTPGGMEYPFNVSVDIGEDGFLDWQFDGAGYGKLGYQYLLMNSTNISEYKTVPFAQPGSDESISVRLPKGANVTKANLRLAPASVAFNITKLLKMQAWAPSGSGWVTGPQPASTMCDELNSNILYDSMWLDVSTMPANAFIHNATFWWARAGTSPYETWGRSFDDQLSINRIEETWSYPTARMLSESRLDQDTNSLKTKCVYYPWNMTNTFMSWYNGSAPNYGVCLHRTAAADNDKWDYSMSPYIIVMYGRPGNVTMTMKGGADIQLFNQSGPMTIPYMVPDFSAALNDYLDAHDADYIDVFGNEFCSVPLAISSTDIGAVNISGLDLAYKWDAMVDENPYNINLTNVLDPLVSKAIDGGYTDIKLPIFVNSSFKGKVKVSGIKIDFMPPDHAATIDTRTPDMGNVVINENESIEFVITASDLYKYPLNASWFFNKKEVAHDQWNWSHFADFESAGKYNVTVTVWNGMHETSLTWNLTVKNVNRQPVLNTWSPPDAPTMKENSSLEFRVNASDPDRDPLRYAWFINREERTGNSIPSLNFTTDFASSGTYDVRVMMMDPGGLAINRTWRLFVENVNVPPKIDAFNPKVNVKLKETESMTFSIMASDYDKQPLSISWFLNGTEVGTSLQYIFKTDYSSAGNYTLVVAVNDSVASDRHTWLITVENVNRNPIPFIDKPTADKEFMDTEDIKFSAISTKDPDGDAMRYRWTEAVKDISTMQEFEMRFPAGEHEVTMEVTDALGGVNTSSIKFVVRFIRLTANMSIDKQKYTEGDMASITATVSNLGDARAQDVPVEFIVDNRTVETKTINGIDGGGADVAKFDWKTVKGPHTLTIRVGNETWNTTVKVDARLIPGVAGGTATLIAISLILILIIACVAGGAYVYYRKKKAKQNAYSASELSTAPQPAPLVGPAAYVTLSQPAPVYPPAQTMLVQQPPAPGYPPAPTYSAQPAAYGYAPPPPPGPTPQPAYATPPPMPPQQAAPPAAPQTGPVVTEQREAEELLAITESQLQQYEAAGNVNDQARQTVRLARHFYTKGAFVKAISYCEKAESLMK